MNILEIKGLTKDYGKGKGAFDINLTIKPGKIFAFIGPNGAGKTTTIKCVAGISGFDKGEILVNGLSIKNNPVGCKKEIAYIPDNPDLYEHLKGIQYLNFIADIYEVGKEDRENKIKKFAIAFDILEALGDPINSYSHGMKQKLAIISALIHEPKLLILDEPFVGLDPTMSHKLKEIFKEMCKNGNSIFFSTHILEVAEKLCDEVAIIDKGRIIASGDMKKVVKDKSLEDTFMELMKNE